MISYYLSSSDDAERLVTLCRKYDNDIDVVYQRYTVDGKSILGVMSLIGHTVGIMFFPENDPEISKVQEEFEKKLHS